MLLLLNLDKGPEIRWWKTWRQLVPRYISYHLSNGGWWVLIYVLVYTNLGITIMHQSMWCSKGRSNQGDSGERHFSIVGDSDMTLLTLGNCDIEFYNKRCVWTLGNSEDSGFITHALLYYYSHSCTLHTPYPVHNFLPIWSSGSIYDEDKNDPC